MEHLVQKIVQVYFPQFSEMDVKDTPHQYTQQSQKKSEIVSIYIIYNMCAHIYTYHFSQHI